MSASTTASSPHRLTELPLRPSRRTTHTTQPVRDGPGPARVRERVLRRPGHAYPRHEKGRLTLTARTCRSSATGASSYLDDAENGTAVQVTAERDRNRTRRQGCGLLD